MTLSYLISALSLIVLIASGIISAATLRSGQRKGYLVYVIFPVSQIIIAAMLIQVLISYQMTLWFFIGVFVLCIACGVANWVLFKALRKAEEKQFEKDHVRLLEEQLKLQEAYALKLEGETARAQEIRMQVANELRITEEYLDRKEDVSTFDTRMAHTMELMDEQQSHLCQHRIIDALLSSKMQVCKEHDVRFTSELNIPANLPFTSADLCAVFSNLFDNAINACKTVDKDKRWIDCKANLQAGFFIVGMSNSRKLNAEVRKQASEDEVSLIPEHGWGLYILEHVALKYEGSCTSQEEDDCYRSTVILKVPPTPDAIEQESITLEAEAPAPVCSTQNAEVDHA